ncbi:MAG: phosphotransferase [Ignavibacteriales bacterium]|nr:phosphotransferase [Ignavibacteriales bacterium]
MNEIKHQNLKKIFEKWADEKVTKFVPLPPSGSYREYYRIKGKTKLAIGAFNPDRKENVAFLTFSKHFIKKGLNVPKIYAEDLNNDIYLLEDLGDVTLFSYLVKVYKKGIFPQQLIAQYKKVIEELPKFQILASKDLDYSVSYPRDSFDKQSMHWDMSYFKYYFLKLAKISFDEQNLENDFVKLIKFLLKPERDYFLYRDFQSRNIMLVNNEPYFIDYQGGRKGALQYDLASLLYDAKADIPQHIRNQLLDYYIEVTRKIIPINEKKFKEFYYGYVLIRIMQAMGAYGFRGFYEKKEHFLKSVPYAINNLKWIIDNVELPIKIPTLWDVFSKLVRSEKLKEFGEDNNQLKVRIFSFAYKKGIPPDTAGNGGGFVFDCRALHNPGRYEQYAKLTGKHKEVINFFEEQKNIFKYLKNVFSIIDDAVDNYQKRKFTDLMVSFGCTGGQHRSVFCAEALAKHLKEKYDIKIELMHNEL